ncbi:MAG: hypothetical protein A2020_01290 [Lentisphaerae bacterium GWF2_45_14]|nr:MAG: hypothetical protein A2020_01290 [Lentisphaerae bacterium GWF2_45_14]
MKKNAYLILVAISALLLQGCDNPIVKSIMKKMPWAKEEKVKSETDILREQLQALEDQYREKKEELGAIKVENKISDSQNRVDSMQVRWKCSACGQIAVAIRGAQPGKCMYCGGNRYDQAAIGGIANKEEAMSKNKRAVELQKEIQDLNVKIANMRDMVELLEKKKK